MDLDGRRVANACVFAACGAAMLATSAEPDYFTTFHGEADLPSLQLDNSTSDALWRIRVDATETPLTALTESARAVLILTATHSDAQPNRLDDNTPWITVVPFVSETSGELDLGGAGAGSFDEDAAGPAFLQTATATVPIVFSGDCDGSGECIGNGLVLVRRAHTADDDLVSTVSGFLEITVRTSAEKDSEKDLPWTIEVEAAVP